MILLLGQEFLTKLLTNLVPEAELFNNEFLFNCDDEDDDIVVGDDDKSLMLSAVDSDCCCWLSTITLPVAVAVMACVDFKSVLEGDEREFADRSTPSTNCGLHRVEDAAEESDEADNWQTCCRFSFMLACLPVLPPVLLLLMY